MLLCLENNERAMNVWEATKGDQVYNSPATQTATKQLTSFNNNQNNKQLASFNNNSQKAGKLNNQELASFIIAGQLNNKKLGSHGFLFCGC